MNMLNFQKMRLIDAIALNDSVIKHGKPVGTIYNKRTRRRNNLLKYHGDTFQVDDFMGIVDINNSMKDLEG